MADCRTSGNVQWVIVNDASTDADTLGSLDGLRQYADVTVIDLDENVGPGEARNQGVVHANGKWIAFIDSDDRCDVRELISACTSSATREADVLSLAYGWRANARRTNWIAGGPPGKGFWGLVSRRPAVWRFVFRDNFLRGGPRFPTLRYGEDLVFLLQVARLNPVVLGLPSSAAVTYRVPDSRRFVSQEERVHLLEELATLRGSSISNEERACIDSWALRVMAHGLRRDAAAYLRDPPYPRPQPRATARALGYTFRAYLRSGRRGSASLVSRATRLSGERSW